MNAFGGEHVEPSGRNLGSAVQFDAVIEFHQRSSACDVVLFARYWVSTNFYYLGVVWGEPHGRGLDFSVYPPTMTIGSTEQAFKVGHQLNPGRNFEATKPFGSRGAFKSMFGDYAVSNARFAEQEAESSRIFVSDLSDLHPATNGPESAVEVVIGPGLGSARDLASLRLTRDSDTISSIDVYDRDQRLAKRISYSFWPGSEPPRLKREQVELAERPMVLGLPDGGLVVTTQQTNTFRITEFLATYGERGRTSVVDFKPVAVGATVVSLPERVTVNDASGVELRGARLGGFCAFTFGAEAAAAAANRYAGFTPALARYRELITKYWKHSPRDVSTTDKSVLEDLRHQIEATSQEAGASLGEEMRRINALMELSRLLGDEEGLLRYYRRYLSDLAGNGLKEMLVVGGYTAVDTSVLWGRWSEAFLLLNAWLDRVSESLDLATILDLAAGELRKGNCCATAKLLERAERLSCDSSAIRFEISALAALSLTRLERLVENERQLKSEIDLAQAQWALRLLGKAEIGRRMAQSLESARERLQAAGGKLSDSQKALALQVLGTWQGPEDSGGSGRPSGGFGTPNGTPP